MMMEKAVMPWMNWSAAALMAAGLLTLWQAAGCKREPAKMPTVTRPPAMVAPTTQEVTQEKRNDIIAEFQPIPRMADGITEKTPDGEVWTKFSNGLMIHDLFPSDGTTPHLGQTLSIAYTGTIPSDDPAHVRVFDQASADKPFTFQLGSNKVIRGLSLGVASMKVGMKRRIYVPADLAYGAAGQPQAHIPPDQPLIFEVELLSVTGESLEALVPALPKFEPAGPPAPATAPAPGGR
jgi:peptidylprolyl isomerase